MFTEEATPDAWWRVLPWATSWSATDVCHQCGHVRSLHSRDRTGLIKRVTENCRAKGCECGPDLAKYHIAGYVGPKDTMTQRNADGAPMGRVVQIEQPAPPGKPIRIKGE